MMREGISGAEKWLPIPRIEEEALKRDEQGRQVLRRKRFSIR
jgi:hypothetical protein